MNEPLFVENSISINASPAEIWDTLVNPEQTKKYMFGCETVSDWKVGSELLWKGSYEGQDMIFVKGNILDIQPGRYLAYSTIDPHNTAIPDLPENYLTVTYKLEENGAETILTTTQGDYSKVAEGEKRYKETIEGGGWQPILEAIKKLLESK